eukprot:11780655-Alexandrium_andersonii.AAC.1
MVAWQCYHAMAQVEPHVHGPAPSLVVLGVCYRGVLVVRRGAGVRSHGLGRKMASDTSGIRSSWKRLEAGPCPPCQVVHGRICLCGAQNARGGPRFRSSQDVRAASSGRVGAVHLNTQRSGRFVSLRTSQAFHSHSRCTPAGSQLRLDLVGGS